MNARLTNNRQKATLHLANIKTKESQILDLEFLIESHNHAEQRWKNFAPEAGSQSFGKENILDGCSIGF